MNLIPFREKPTRFRKIYPLKDLIIKALDDNQELKRLMVYPTKNPFDEYGMTYDGKLIKQLDIKDSLLDDFNLSLIDESNGEEFILKNECCIFDYAWQDRQTNINYPTIYVSHYRTSDDIVGKITYEIAIIIPSEYEPLINGKRSTEIIIAIGDILDRAITDKESSKEIGDLELRVGDVYESKLVKSIKSTLITTTVTATIINNNRIVSNPYDKSRIL